VVAVSVWASLLLRSEPVKSSFVNVDPAAAGIGFQHFSGSSPAKEMVEIMGSGVALLDYDNDGDLDLFFVNGAALPQLSKTRAEHFNRLYRNDGSFQFSDVTTKAGLAGSGYGMGVACADYDNDGDTDIYLTQVGSNVLYRNNGDGTFVDVTSQVGVAAGGWSSSAAFIDVDRDGNLDLYVARYVDYEVGKGQRCGNSDLGLVSYCLPDVFPPTRDVLYRSNGDGTFRDFTVQSGIGAYTGNGLGVVAGDLDDDGWPDIFVANDRTPNFLFHNNGQGTFEEIGVASGVAYSADGTARAGMGVDIGDFDGDLRLDIAVSNFEGEGLALFRNLGKLFFQDVAGKQRLREATYSYVGFGLGWIDYNNDGWVDMLSANGHVLDDIERYKPHIRFAQPTLLLGNQDGTLRNTNPAPDDPLNHVQVSRGAAFGDLDNDGSIDAVIQKRDGPPQVLRNAAVRDKRSVLVRLEGTRSNRDAIGAQLTVTAGGRQRRLEIQSGRSYLSSSDLRIHLGLGAADQVERLDIRWPSGFRQVISSLRGGQVYHIRENDSCVE
jgi:hypothetical protein